MHDAVADVLHEREGIGRRNSPVGIVASVLLHFIIFVLLVIGARLTPAEPIRPVIAMRLAGSSGMRSSAMPQPRLATPAVTKPSIPMPVPEVKPADVKEERPVGRPAEKSIWGKSTEKPKEGAPKHAPAPSTVPAGAVPAVAAGSPFSVPGIGTAGVTQLEGGDFPYTIYIDRILTIVGQHWFRPQTTADSLTTVYFIIQRDGQVTSPKVEKSSGNSVFDRAAIRAVIESSPLPPLPFGYQATDLGVHLTFH